MTPTRRRSAATPVPVDVLREHAPALVTALGVLGVHPADPREVLYTWDDRTQHGDPPTTAHVEAVIEALDAILLDPRTQRARTRPA